MGVVFQMSYIRDTGVVFDIGRLISDYRVISDIVRQDQICLRRTDKCVDHISYGSGSLYDINLAAMYADERDWKYDIEQFSGYSIVCDVLREIKVYASGRGWEVGRARLMSMRPKTCLTYHIDYGNAKRLHVPIVTNESCFFIHNGQASQMLDVGRMYEFDTSVMHTAINASRVMRTHLVVSCY